MKPVISSKTARLYVCLLHACLQFVCLQFVCLQFVCLQVSGGYKVVEHVYIPDKAYKVNTRTMYTLAKVTSKLTWNEAVGACQNMFPNQGGTLAKTETMEEQDIITDLLVQSNSDDAWFGLHWQDTTTLAWADDKCNTFDTDLFTQFKDGEDIYDQNKRCYMLDKDTGFWMYDDCSQRKHFVCQHWDSDMSNCSTVSEERFNEVKAVFQTVPDSQASSITCTETCLNITGCFLTWPATDSCLIGLADSGGGAYVKKKCYGVNVTTDAGSYTSNSAKIPGTCQPLKKPFFAASNGTNLAFQGQALGQCGSRGPDVSSSPVVTSYVDTTVTLSSLIASWECTSTVTSLSIQPTTVTEVSTATLSDTTTLITTASCFTEVISPTSCPPLSTIIATTATQVATSTITEVATSILTSCAQTSCDVTASQYGGVVTHTVTNSDCVTSSAASPVVEVITVTEVASTVTTEVPTTVVATVSECESTISVTETTTATSPISTTVNVTPSSVDAALLTSSLVQELLVHTSNLSSTRRKKESATDNRTTAQVSGWFAISFIFVCFGAILLADIPTCYRHIGKRFRRLQES